MNRHRAGAQLACRVIAAVGILTLAPMSAQAARADDSADGRRRAQRASALAAKGKCKQAISEFDKAIAVLHDPALLFNRGECHRKLGNIEAALEDYNQFLSDLPTAPNRAQVESRIAELKKAAATSPGAAAIAPPAAPAATGAAASPKASPKPEPRAAAGESAGGRATAPVSEGESVSNSTRLAPAASPNAADSAGSNPLLLANQDASPPQSPSTSSGDSLASRPWFWIAVGAVVVGAGVGAYLVLGRDGTSIPPSDLGNYKF